jgi:FkbM family methyltransferase
VGEDISFDRGAIAAFGCKVFAFDPTPKSIEWLRQQALPKGFSSYEIGIGDETKETTFFLPKNPNHVSGSFVAQDNTDKGRTVSVQLQSFADMASGLGHDRVDVLKMDIEGGEYAVIDSILRGPVRPAQILIEFHDRFFDEGEQITIDAITKLRASGYELFAVSPSFEEVSFIDINTIFHQPS